MMDGSVGLFLGRTKVLVTQPRYMLLIERSPPPPSRAACFAYLYFECRGWVHFLLLLSFVRGRL